eukprot:SAG31_NODE_4266_length_3393_cov_4.735883_4_plen_295_part_00
MVDTVRGTDANAGLYVGLLASSYFWAQFAAAFVWGALPLKFGCKRCMIFSSVAVGVSLIGFGMSESYAAACGWRLVGGLLNGNMPVVKSYLAKITDKSNQAKGFSVLSFSWGLGGLVAPTFGGFLSEPALKYPGLQLRGTIWERWPYLLPCAAAATVCFVAAAAVLLWIPDDGPRSTWASRRGLAQYTRVEQAEEHSSTHTVDDSADASLAFEGGKKISVYSTQEGKNAELSYMDLLRPSNSGLACLAYLWSSLNFVIFDEMFPLYCKADYEHGGLNWETDQIGAALSIGGLVL